ncbi:MAG: tagaturonate reductase [Defluviitaleaceae bacterium]|nr:tagaturonate reductase [Defluviitaleaceae bacterium]
MRQIGKQDRTMRRPAVVAQFGEGNFLRAFAEQMIDAANEKGAFDGGVAVIKPIPFGSLEAFERQDDMYTVILRGIMGGQKIVESRAISAMSQVIDPFADYEAYLELARSEALRFVISNTTEAGITYDATDKFDQHPAATFPGKLTQFLYARFEHFAGAPNRGLIILPVELIDQNGDNLRECVLKFAKLWSLSAEFTAWLDEACIFCNCLVDRIVSGYPSDAENLESDLLGYCDELMVVGEPFGLWVIASDRHVQVQKEFPLDAAGLPVVFTNDARPYRERKVRILNGAHTSSVLAAYLMGFDTVDAVMANTTTRKFVERALYGEIAPTVQLPPDEVRRFAESVVERFENPFLQHKLLSISLNSVSKWKARVLPSLKDSFASTGVLPPCLSFSLAALIAFYRSDKRGDGCLIGIRSNGDTYEIRDDAYVLDFFAENANLEAHGLAKAVLGNTAFWEEDLNRLNGFTELVAEYLTEIEKQGMETAIKSVIW